MSKAPPRPKPIALDDIRIDGDTQSRQAIDESIVAEYADAYAAGATLPPVVVYFDGAANWLADGFHRYHARRRGDYKAVDAIVLEGTKTDAQWAASAANKAHGLRRTNADKRRAVQMALAAHPDDSDRAIAEHVGVSNTLVGEIRAQLSESDSSPEPKPRIGRDGRTRKVPQKPAAAEPATPPAESTGDEAPPATPQAHDVDGIGRPIHPAAKSALGAAWWFADVVKRTHMLKREVLDQVTRPGGRVLNAQRIERLFKDLVSAIGGAAPVTSCPCHEDCAAAKCKACKGTQYLTADEWKAVPAEFKR